MCMYEACYHTVCNHYTFKLHLFCKTTKQQLDRINNPADRDIHAIPCKPLYSCRPTVLRIDSGNLIDNVAEHAIAGTRERWNTNVVAWTNTLFCEACWEEWRIPEIEWDLNLI
ncbi:hypothetical protein N7507_003143 [Penicillium longicatenatum]|nr:hypothetical protein N7507_003143 [Penicillium longicatenatum]